MIDNSIAIIDADLITGKQHRFPNLASMKLSGYYKDNGSSVKLITSYNDFEGGAYDKIFLSKVFTDTYVPDNILTLPNIQYGGTGFNYYNAPELIYEIEHHMPDYHLYDEWVTLELNSGKSKPSLKYFTDYSIGYTSRFCIRGCDFCVNRYKRQSISHSPVIEFLDERRKYICILDDNILACKDWENIFHQLQDTGKRFQYKQGLDERLLTDKKCEEIFCKSKWIGEYIFAFDNIADKDIIIKNINLIRKYTQKILKFYCFCGYDRNNKWNDSFYEQDIIDLLTRIEVLSYYKCLPYIMRYNRYVESPYRGLYITLTRWCNQPQFFKKKSLLEFTATDGKGSASEKYINDYMMNHKWFEKWAETKWFSNNN